jgi:hypothetical protein
MATKIAGPGIMTDTTAHDDAHANCEEHTNGHQFNEQTNYLPTARVVMVSIV